MIRSTCTVIILIAYMLGSHSIIGAGVNYLCNYRYFAEHCVNKDKPELECDGKCGMMDEMNEQDGQAHDSDVLHHIVNLPTLKLIEHTHDMNMYMPILNEQTIPTHTTIVIPTHKGFARLPLNPPRA
jgi:hypothetical protein